MSSLPCRARVWENAKTNMATESHVFQPMYIVDVLLLTRSFKISRDMPNSHLFRIGRIYKYELNIRCTFKNWARFWMRLPAEVSAIFEWHSYWIFFCFPWHQSILIACLFKRKRSVLWSFVRMFWWKLLVNFYSRAVVIPIAELFISCVTLRNFFN